MKQHPIAARHNKCRSDGIIPCLCWNMIIIIMVTNGNGHCWSVTNCECDFCCCYCCCSYSLLHCVPIFWPCILHHEQLDCSLRLPCLRLFPQLQQLLLALKAKSRRFGFLVGAAKNVHQKVKHMSDNNLLKQRRNVTQLNGPLQHWTTSTKTHNPLHQKNPSTNRISRLAYAWTKPIPRVCATGTCQYYSQGHNHRIVLWLSLVWILHV